MTTRLRTFNKWFSKSSQVTVLLLCSVVLLNTLVVETAEAKRMGIKSSKSGHILPVTAHDLGRPWCTMKSFQQQLRVRGCKEQHITNNLCFGQCRSFFIPRRKNYFQSCSACTPVSAVVKKVALECPDRRTKRVVKEVKIITSCECRVCGQLYI